MLDRLKKALYLTKAHKADVRTYTPVYILLWQVHTEMYKTQCMLDEMTTVFVKWKIFKKQSPRDTVFNTSTNVERKLHI